MKKSFLLLVTFFFINALYFTGCTKSGSSGGSTGGGGSSGGGGGGVGSNGSLTVTGIAPAIPYPDDQLTLTGTGFNPDKTKDTVEFGEGVGGGFHLYNDGFSTGYQTTIVSASATQLVISAVSVQDLEFSNFGVTGQSKTIMRIRANGKTVLTSVIPFKHRLFINLIGNSNIIRSVTGCVYLIQPGDSISLGGSGFYKPCSVYLGGVKIDAAKFDDDNITRCVFRIPPGIFGEMDENCTLHAEKFKIVNGDGKSYERDYNMPLSPPMVINGVAFEKNEYKVSDGHAVLNVAGYCLYSTAVMRISGTNGFSMEGPLTGISGYPSHSQQMISLGTLPAPTGATSYSITIKKSPSDSYGFSQASFLLKP